MEMRRKNEDDENEIMNINSELPSHIVDLIFSKFPFFNLPTCRLVCKAWNNLVLTGKSDPPTSNLLFAQISPYHNLHCVDLDAKYLRGMNMVASFNLDPKWSRVQIANSCNGLVCVWNPRRTAGVGILNPMTNEYIHLRRGDGNRHYRYGLGFSPKTKQYKIARHSSTKKEGDMSSMEIFALGPRGRGRQPQWSLVASGTFDMIRHGVYFNGAIYWSGYDKKSDDHWKIVIWRLDVEDEKLEEIWCPPYRIGQVHSVALGVFDGSLYLTLLKLGVYEYHVWKMEEGGLWITAFVIVGIPPTKFSNPRVQPFENFQFQLIKLCEDGKILCLLQGIHLVMYDPKTGLLENLDPDQGIKKSFRIFHIRSNFNSLRHILSGDRA